MEKRSTWFLAVGLLWALASCQAGPSGGWSVGQPVVVATGLDTPWGIAFLPDGSMLVTERPGRVRLVDASGQLRAEPVATLGSVAETGEGGLLGIALHPDFGSNRLVYLYYTYAGVAGTMNRVVRMAYGNGSLGTEEIVLDGIPGASFHDGGRIKFGPDGFLYIGTGDAGQASLAQDTGSLAGKILRVSAAGTPAPGNPFGNEVYSYGHRNVQGLAWDENGTLYATEHGRSGTLSGLDEINLIEAGKNYGWPVIQGDETHAGMETPLDNSGSVTWAPSGAAFFAGSLYFGGLRGESLYEAVIRSRQVTQVIAHFQGQFGRLSLSSLRDIGGMPRHATGTNVTAVTFTDEDHFAVAASTRAFVELYRYLRGSEPQYTAVQCGEPMVTVEGIAETFADNVPQQGTLEVREVGNTPRDPGPPVAVLTPDAAGHFGPIQLQRGAFYEFKGLDDAGALIGYQYFTPFKRSNRLVRVLAPPANPAIRAASTDHVVRGPGHAALIARWDGGGFRQDLGASLTIDGLEVLTSENAGEAALETGTLDGGVVGVFMYDADVNGQTSLGLVYSAPFLSFTDVFLDASTPRFLAVRFTGGSEDPSIVGQSLLIPNWPSDDALILMMFQ
jgi:glucose/arabinose dehydrogenase